MAVKTFTSGEVLTAADTNTYLANAGLVYVKSQTVGSGVTSVSVTSAFSSDYRNYLIVYSAYTASSAGSLRMQLSNSTGTTYSMSGIYLAFGSTTVNGYGPAAADKFADVGRCGATPGYLQINVYDPQESIQTRIAIRTNNGNSFYLFDGYDSSTNSSTGFTFDRSSGTFSGGTITVYGYRKA